MQITLATGLYDPEIGGPATHTKTLETHLSKEHFTLSVVPFTRVRSMPKFIRHIAYTFQLIKDAKKSDLIYALDPVSVGLPAYIASRICRVPLIVRVAGDYAWEQGWQRFDVSAPLEIFVHNTKRYRLQVRMLVAIERFVARRAEHVVVPSKYLRDILLVWGVKKENTTVIYSVFEPNEVSKGRDALREKFDYAGVVLISVGRLVPWKGFRTLIELLPELEEELEEKPTLVIVGDGPSHAALEARAREVGVAEQVRLVGRKSQDELLEMIKAADMFVLNTAYEGFSHQLLEVMDIGTSIVTTDVGGNPELIEDSVHGLLVPYDDRDALKRAIARVYANPALQARLTESARARSREFDHTHMIDAITTLFERYEPEKTEQYKY